MEKKNSILRKLSKVNFSTVFFFILSLVSSTFAWFAYNNVVNSNIDIELKTWDISMTEGGSDISQVLNITLDNFSPGISNYERTVNIQNNGDMPAVIDFDIEYLRILDDVYSGENKEELLDSLSYDYPYFFNFYLWTGFLNPGDFSNFDVVIGWPLDSGNDALDSEWGSAAYEFYHNEQVNLVNDPSYEVRPCIELRIKLNSRQYVEEEDTIVSDSRNQAGNSMAYGFYHAYVLDMDSKSNESNVNIIYKEETLRNYADTIASVSDATTDMVSASEYLGLLSTDIFNSKIKKTGISDRNLGTIYTDTRAQSIIDNMVSNNSYVEIDSSGFLLLDILDTGTCMWTNTSVDSNRAIAISRNGSTIKLYVENKSANCYRASKVNIPKLCVQDECKIFYISSKPYSVPKDWDWGSWISNTGYSYHNAIACLNPNNYITITENNSCNNETKKINYNYREITPQDNIVERGYYTIEKGPE